MLCLQLVSPTVASGKTFSILCRGSVQHYAQPDAFQDAFKQWTKRFLKERVARHPSLVAKLSTKPKPQASMKDSLKESLCGSLNCAYVGLLRSTCHLTWLEEDPGSLTVSSSNLRIGINQIREVGCLLGAAPLISLRCDMPTKQKILFSQAMSIKAMPLKC